MVDADEQREQRAEQLKERIYVTLTALAVVLVLRSEADQTTPGTAAAALAVTVGATLLAVFVADVIAHITVHAAVPSGAELLQMLRVVTPALGVLVLPVILLRLAATEVMTLDRALRVSSIALVASLVVIGYLAVRRLRISLFPSLVVLLAEFALGLAVVALELLAH